MKSPDRRSRLIGRRSMGCSRCSFPRFVVFFGNRFSQLHSVVLGEGEFSRPRAERVENHPIHRKIEDQRVEAAALGSIIMDRTAAIDQKNTVAIKIVELQIVIVVDEAEVLSTRRFEPRYIGLSQGHTGIQAAAVAIVVKTRVFLPSHTALSYFPQKPLISHSFRGMPEI